jgi:hypothetical protein
MCPRLLSVFVRTVPLVDIENITVRRWSSYPLSLDGATKVRHKYSRLQGSLPLGRTDRSLQVVFSVGQAEYW